MSSEKSQGVRSCPTIRTGDCFAALAMTCFKLHTSNFKPPTGKRAEQSQFLRPERADGAGTCPCGHTETGFSCNAALGRVSYEELVGTVRRMLAGTARDRSTPGRHGREKMDCHKCFGTNDLGV